MSRSASVDRPAQAVFPASGAEPRLPADEIFRELLRLGVVGCPLGAVRTRCGWIGIFVGQPFAQAPKALAQTFADIAQPLRAEHEQNDDEHDEPVPDAHCSHNYTPSFFASRIKR